MDCAHCRSLLSDFSENSLDPESREETIEHLRVCGECRRELGDFRQMLGALKRVELAPPPAGLLEAPLVRLQLPPAPAARGRWMVRCLAAAALLLLGLNAWLLAARWSGEGDWNGRLAALKNELASDREENARLAGDVRLARQSEEKANQALQEAISRSASDRSAFQGQLADLQKRSSEQALALASIRNDLLAARQAENRLKTELRRAQDELAMRPEAVEEPDDGDGQAAASGTEAPSVAFIQRGDVLELQLSGDREKVIPELLAIAADDSNPRLASLALSALENLQEAEGPASKQPAAATDAAGGFLGLRTWWNRKTDAITGSFGSADEPGRPESSEDFRRQRLKTAEEKWGGSRTK